MVSVNANGSQALTYKEEHDSDINEESETDKDMLVPGSLQSLHKDKISDGKLNSLISVWRNRAGTYYFVNDEVAVDAQHKDSYHPHDNSHDTTLYIQKEETKRREDEQGPLTAQNCLHSCYTYMYMCMCVFVCTYVP